MGTEIIKFTETPEEELLALTRELQLDRVIGCLTTNAPIPVDLKDSIQTMVLTLADMFGTSLPAIDNDPVETLRMASRDINLGRVLKERGMFRLYRMLHTDIAHTEEDGATGIVYHYNVPVYQTQTNPDTGERFKRQEDFIGWFCREARVSRAVVFQRMSTIDRLLDLGFELEEAYATILSKPAAIRDTLKLVAYWDKGSLIDVKPEVATRLAEKMLPPAKANRVKELADKISQPEIDEDEQQEARQELAEELRPAIGALVREVARHQNVRDAMDFVRHDIAGKPEIKFHWDYDRDEMEIELVRKGIDPGGTEYITEVVTIRLIPDPVMPPEVRSELMNRLPMTNRERLD